MKAKSFTEPRSFIAPPARAESGRIHPPRPRGYPERDFPKRCARAESRARAHDAAVVLSSAGEPLERVIGSRRHPVPPMARLKATPPCSPLCRAEADSRRPRSRRQVGARAGRSTTGNRPDRPKAAPRRRRQPQMAGPRRRRRAPADCPGRIGDGMPPTVPAGVNRARERMIRQVVLSSAEAARSEDGKGDAAVGRRRRAGRRRALSARARAEADNRALIATMSGMRGCAGSAAGKGADSSQAAKPRSRHTAPPMECGRSQAGLARRQYVILQCLPAHPRQFFRALHKQLPPRKTASPRIFRGGARATRSVSGTPPRVSS